MSSLKFQNVLCISSDPISNDSLFVQLGGDSLKAIQLVDRIELELNYKFPKLLELLLSKPFKVISDYVEIVSQEETGTLDLTGIEILEPENVNVTLLRTTSNENVTEFNITNNVKTDVLEVQIRYVNDTYDKMPTLDKVTSNNNNSDVVVKNNESKVTRVTMPDITNYTTLDDKVARINSIPNATTEINEVKVLNYFDNKSKTVYDNLQSSSLEDISNKDKSASTAVEDESVSASHKRSLVLSRENLETKKRKLDKRKFYKFIQRGNRLYDLSEDQNTLERQLAQEFSMQSQDLHSNIVPKIPHDLLGNRSICNNKRMGQLKVSMKERWRYNTGKCVDASPLLAITR